MIELRGVRKSYAQGTHRVTALDNLDLVIATGEFVSIVGASGSGKSTLLQLIGGLDTPNAGEILIGGRRMSLMSDDQITIFRRRGIGFVFQSFNLLSALTATENVALPLLLDRKNGRDARLRADELLELVGMGSRRNHRPDQLSGGESQRVAIARALISNPAVLLADEPTGSLDSKTGEQILRLIRDANRESGTTVVLVTHDPRAVGYGDRTITMTDGKIAESDRPAMADGAPTMAASD